jgi:hypothetical protein
LIDESGVTEMLFVVAFVFQLYVLAPFAVSVVLFPAQKTVPVLLMLRIGSGFTDTDCEALFIHPVVPSVPVTV